MSFASLANYRTRTMRLVQEHFGDRLTLYAGSPAYDSTIRLIDQATLPHVSLSNHYSKHQVLLQNVPLIKFIRSNVLLLDLNPRIPHVWLLLLVRKLLGKPTLLWGHAWPRNGRGNKTEAIRSAMRALATTVVTYTQSQADELRARHPGMTVTAAPNALFSRDAYVFDRDNERRSILFVGRLHPSKKPLLLIPAFERLARCHPEITLDIVGDGPLSEQLGQAVAGSANRSRITLHGHVDEYDKLRTLYARAFVATSPGYAGLSITQSFGFGVPMIISRDEPHAPEIEAAKEGWNSLFFDSDNPHALATAIQDVITEKARLAHGEDIVALCAERYSVEAMAKGLINAIEVAGKCSKSA